MPAILRPARPDDRDFLLRVTVADREPQLAALDWEPGAKQALLLQQARVQEGAHGVGSDRLVVELDGQDIGRLYRRELSGPELRLVDLTLLPPWRGQGIGTALLLDLIAEAQRRRLLLSLHVAHDNPAYRLYTRLGFVPTGQDEVYALLELPVG